MTTSLSHGFGAALLTAVALAGTAPPARAVDTLEPFLPGFSDGEMYVGAQGLGPRGGARGVFAEAAVAYGLTDRVSAWALWDLSADERLGGGEAAMSFTLYGQALQAGVLGVDLLLEVGAGGPGFQQMTVHPAFELNLDAAPDLASWGFFLDGGVVLGGPDPAATDPSEGASAALSLAPGGYWTVAPGHQVLVQLDVSFPLARGGGGSRWDLGTLALGYNVCLGDTVELITEFSVDLPARAGERPSVGFMVGFLATLATRGGAG